MSPAGSNTATNRLPRSLPEEQGIDSAGIDGFLDAVQAAPDVELHSLAIIRHGHVVADGWWSPYDAQQPHLLYSLSKSFTSTAAGFAVAEGLLDLDATVLSYFPEYDEVVTDPRSRAMLVRDIAAMASGHATETWERAAAGLPQDPVLTFLKLAPEADPGSVFAYNQPCTYTLAKIIQRESGQRLTDYLRPRLFDPLGIGVVGWQDLDGYELGFTGLHATTAAIARLGLLYLQRGVWNDEQLLSPDWVAEATSRQVDTDQEENPDWAQGYGFQFWMARHGFRGDGAYGQFCVVLPEHDLVVAITGCSPDMQAVVSALWDHLLPALSDEPLPRNSDSSAVLARLGAAALPPLLGTARPLPSARLTVEHTDQPSLVAVELADGPDGPQLILLEDGARLDLTVGIGQWTSNAAVRDHGRSGVPAAASGGWQDDDTFAVDVLFLQTPHRLSIRCAVAAGTCEAVWNTVPLRGGQLADLAMPRP